MFYGWRIVGSAFVAQLFVIGFFTYTISLLVPSVRAEFDVSLEQVMYGLTIGTFTGIFLMPIAGILADRVSVRWIMAFGTVMFALGLFALSRCSGITQYIVLFGLTMAVSNAFAGALCSSTVISRWFTGSRGKALGVAAVGTSVGGVVIPWLFTLWLENAGWRGALENTSLVVLCIMLPIVIAGIRGKPSDVGLTPESGGGESTAGPDLEDELGTKAIIISSRFWYIGLSLGLLFAVYTAILSNLTPYAVGLGMSAKQASLLITAVAASGLVGKILFGMAADTFSLKGSLWVAQFMVALGFVLLAQEPGYTLMIIATVLLGLATGGMLPVWGSMMAHAFGVVSYGRAMGLMNPLITLVVMPAFPLVGRLVDMSGSYVSTLYLFVALTVVAMVLLVPLTLSRAEHTD